MLVNTMFILGSNYININKSSTNNTSEQIEYTAGSYRFNSLSKKIKLKMKTCNFKTLNSDRKAFRNIVSFKSNVEKVRYLNINKA